MANLVKTQGTTVISLTGVSGYSVFISQVQDVSTKLAATVFVHFGRRNSAAAGAGVNIRIEASAKSTGNGYWFPIASYTTDFAACQATIVSGSSASGETFIPMAATAGFTTGDTIYIDNTTIANSEWQRVRGVLTNSRVLLEDPLTNTQSLTSIVYDRAEMYACQLDLTAIGRLRIVADGTSFTQAFAIESLMVTGDSIQ